MRSSSAREEHSEENGNISLDELKYFQARLGAAGRRGGFVSWIFRASLFELHEREARKTRMPFTGRGFIAQWPAIMSGGWMLAGCLSIDFRMSVDFS